MGIDYLRSVLAAVAIALATASATVDLLLEPRVTAAYHIGLPIEASVMVHVTAEASASAEFDTLRVEEIAAIAQDVLFVNGPSTAHDRVIAPDDALVFTALAIAHVHGVVVVVV